MFAAYRLAAAPSNSLCKSDCFTYAHPFLLRNNLKTVTLHSAGETDEYVIVEISTSRLVCVGMERALEINLPVALSYVCSVVDKNFSDTWKVIVNVYHRIPLLLIDVLHLLTLINKPNRGLTSHLDH